MDEDILSPQLGRLIDAAKAAAASHWESGPAAAGLMVCRDAVALLTESGRVFTGRGGQTDAASAAGAAQATWREEGGDQVVAACSAHAGVGDDGLPCPGCRHVLADLDADLPLVVKFRGRWVLTAVSNLPDQDEPS